MATANMVPKTDYCIVSGLRPEVAEQLAAEMEKAVGYPPALMHPTPAPSSRSTPAPTWSLSASATAITIKMR